MKIRSTDLSGEWCYLQNQNGGQLLCDHFSTPNDTKVLLTPDFSFFVLIQRRTNKTPISPAAQSEVSRSKAFQYNVPHLGLPILKRENGEQAFKDIY